MIVVNTGGDGIKLAATISFENAKVTSVTVDVGATGIAAGVFKYENGGLTMMAFDNVTESRQKVTATFSLAPNDSRDTLINPTETIEIEVVKAFSKVETDIADIIKAYSSDFVQVRDIFFMPQNPQNDKFTVTNKSNNTKDTDTISPDEFKDKVLVNIFPKSNSVDIPLKMVCRVAFFQIHIYLPTRMWRRRHKIIYYRSHCQIKRESKW